MNRFVLTVTIAAVLLLDPDTAAGAGATFEESLRLAKEGDAAAQVKVGMAYDSGRGAEKDLAKALDWYRKAAAQGNGNAMLQIAYNYDAGTGVEKDIRMAVEWFQKAQSTPQRDAAGFNLVRLSRAGLIKEKYVGIPVEGGGMVTLVDESVPIPKALEDLAANPGEIETGKAYWIGYNPQMLGVGARGETAIPFLLEFIKGTKDPKVRHAGLLALHLVGIECVVEGRFLENFKNRKAREAMWELMKVEGLTDEVAGLLQRDPWPADVPAIMDALAVVKEDCPKTLNALLRYPMAKRPVDTGSRWMDVSFTKPKQYSDRDFVRLAIEGIKQNSSIQVEVEDGLLEQIPVSGTMGNPAPKKWEGALDKLLAEIKGLSPPFDYTQPGRAVYYHLDDPTENGSRPVLHFYTAVTAKKRWLEWWQTSGRNWYCNRP